MVADANGSRPAFTQTDNWPQAISLRHVVFGNPNIIGCLCFGLAQTWERGPTANREIGVPDSLGSTAAGSVGLTQTNGRRNFQIAAKILF
jgi:hypothetical protein